MSFLISFNKIRKVGIIYLPKKKIFRKFTIKNKNYKLINNERQGINWYSLALNKIKKNQIKFEKNYEKDSIDIPLIRGKHIKFWRPLKENVEYAKKVILHYNQVWPKKKIVPCHGDLTFSNIIFKKKNKPQIIDWENFLTKKMSWGYDLAYFLISTVALPSIHLKEKRIRIDELYLLEILWKKLFLNQNYDYLKNPIYFFKKNYLKTFILRNYNNYYPNLLSSKKIIQINEAINIKK